MVHTAGKPLRLAALRRRGETFASAYNTRRNNFDCIRFVLATMVIWSHCFPLSGRRMDWIYAASRQIDGGSLAVDAFFIVSGFLVTQSWLSCPQVTIFARKRFLRIVPALVAALTFGALLIAPLGSAVSAQAYLLSGDPWRHFLGVVFHRYLYISMVFVTNPLPHIVNSPLWSLRYEIVCYAGVALLGLTQPRRWSVTIAAAFVLSWFCYFISGSVSGASSPLNILQAAARLVACFSAGMLFYVLRASVPYHIGLAGAAGVVLLVTFLTAGFRSGFPLAGGYLLLYVAFSPLLPVSRFGRYGDFSYGLYVFGFPIQQTMIHFFGPDIPFAAFFFASFLATVALAYASWHLIEAPALSLKPSRAADSPGTRIAAGAAQRGVASVSRSLSSHSSTWDSQHASVVAGGQEK